MKKYQYKVKGIDYEVEIQEINGNVATVSVNGIPFEVETTRPLKATEVVKPIQQVTPNAVATAAPTAATMKEEPQKAPAAAPAKGKPVVAPLPGTINDIKVKVGDKVKAGSIVVVLEAMKMQNNIESEVDGTVTAIRVNKGDAVLEGDALVVIG